MEFSYDEILAGLRKEAEATKKMMDELTEAVVQHKTIEEVANIRTPHGYFGSLEDHLDTFNFYLDDYLKDMVPEPQTCENCKHSMIQSDIAGENLICDLIEDDDPLLLSIKPCDKWVPTRQYLDDNRDKLPPK